jgi:hypothetical protein
LILMVSQKFRSTGEEQRKHVACLLILTSE